jgi:transcriptional regulator with XRE-family HTH domain
MANENLKNALEKAGLTPEEFAEALRVDPKSVQRWVAGTTVPYPRHRAAISRALNLTEHDLWPNEAAGQPAGEDNHQHENGDDNDGVLAGRDVIGAWAYADDPTTPDLVALITDTTGPIDVLDSCCGIQITQELTDALLAQAEAGREVRVLTDGSAPHWEPLLDHPQIKLYLSEIPGEYWLIKTPDRMLLTINLEHQPGGQLPPILELAATASDGLFHRLASKFEQLWEHTDATEPVDDTNPSSASPTSGRENHTETDGASTTGGRRWPRQPG